MIAFTGHRLDAVVVLTVDTTSSCSGCCSAPRSRAAPTTPRTSSGAARRSTLEQTEPLIEVYREPRDPARGRRHGRGRGGHPADLRRAGRHPESPGGTDRGPSRPRDRDQDPRADRGHAPGRPGGRPAPSSCCGRRTGRDHAPRELDAIAEDNIRSAGATPSFKGYHGVPGLDLRVGQRRGRPRHPGRPGARRGRRHLDRLRGDRRRLARRRGDHRRRRRGARRGHGADARSPRRRCGTASPPPGSAAGSATSPTPSRPTCGRGAATASSRTTSATASAPRCTSRPTSPTTAGPAAAPSWSAASRSPSSRW